MKKIIKILILLSILFLAGCSTVEPPASNMPWAKPADWEKGNMLPGNGLGF